jgi:hypothetical protein
VAIEGITCGGRDDELSGADVKVCGKAVQGCIIETAQRDLNPLNAWNLLYTCCSGSRHPTRLNIIESRLITLCTASILKSSSLKRRKGPCFPYRALSCVRYFFGAL